MLLLNPILIDFPQEIYTERLHIRIPLPGDGEALYQAIQSSFDELKPWLPFVHHEQSLEGAEANVREAYAKFITREDLRLHLFKKDTGEFIGSSGLHRMDWKVRKFEIGYWLDTKFSGYGYMTEAVKAIIDFAFDHLEANRVEIKCDPDNKRSRAIAEKLHFTLEGIIRNDQLSADGSQIRDTCMYARIDK
ncbi:GNAT family N-acetyltransferase [Bacillus sp. FJAT-52991]|uniref:GNAT family N-acetyltransferase n=1 Tax=Bacillus kandeliae TaxID=3129297 RepID=A0ABZ2NBE3_9BACI